MLAVHCSFEFKVSIQQRRKSTNKEYKCTFLFVSRITAVQGQKCLNPWPSGNVNYCTSGGNQRE